MELEFKKDFTEAQKVWDNFWAGKNMLPIISAVLPKPGIEPVAKPPYAAGKNGEFNIVIDQLLRWAETHDFLYSAIPFYYLEFTANQFATFLGAEETDTDGEAGHGWMVPIIKNLDSAEIRFQTNSKGWQFIVERAELLKKRCAGKLLIASPTLVANLDALAALRGTQELLMDLVDNPEGVHRCLKQISVAHKQVLDEFSKVFEYNKYGSINRHGMYSRGRINVAQCDFSCMISPDMFREFALPYIREEIDRYDAGEYHLDGPGAVKHVAAICEIEKLDIIQWVPGAGNEGKDWSALYTDIDNRGKGMLRGGKLQNLPKVWNNTKSNKLFWTTSSASSSSEFADCMATLKKK
ncbi:MAG: hypothetical protein WC955_06890 [Elusimicrobiota bacterium]